jgi:hypothetical protein
MFVDGPFGTGKDIIYGARRKNNIGGFWIYLGNHNGVSFIFRDMATEKEFEPAKRAALMLQGELDRRGIKYKVRKQNMVYDL